MKITGQMNADGALEVSKMLATTVQTLVRGLIVALVLWIIRWW